MNIYHRKFYQKSIEMIIKSGKLKETKLGNQKNSCFSFKSIVKDSMYRSISGRSQGTSNLQLSKMPRLSPSDLKDILRNFPHVKHLDLSGCYQICKESIEVIANGYRDNLLSLNLEFCHYITDEDICTLFAKCKEESKEKRWDMTSLNLSYTNISDSGMRTITLSCPNLKILKLRGMKKITNLTLSMIAKYCKNLTHLDIQDCINITDFGVAIVSQECTHLEILNLNGCNEITNEIFPYLCFYNRSMKELDLRNTKVNGEVLVYILASLSKLEKLKISGLSLNSENIHLPLNLKSLKLLDISFCYDLKKDFICDIIRSCQGLQEIHLFGLINNDEKLALSTLNHAISIFC
jgi:F-box/leucine-rich repeat protein 2/20